MSSSTHNSAERLLFTTTEAGERLGMAPRTVDRLIRQGKLAVVRVPSSGKAGRPRNMVSAAALQQFIESNTVILAPPPASRPSASAAPKRQPRNRCATGSAAAVLLETGVTG